MSGHICYPLCHRGPRNRKFHADLSVGWVGGVSVGDMVPSPDKLIISPSLSVPSLLPVSANKGQATLPASIARPPIREGFVCVHSLVDSPCVSYSCP
ncbi:hypothetical protein PoB_002672300 [Plakobranchus ocellatus]|uniref:Uncharacterized protein n=1 Tax=Plakobranchus ocellatus TaxID=259542 RepID=A0AAV3ZZA9_9GAST|nr:hypothetical protein PoB_002672300 [Plakobranchus ocellatus]